MFVGTGWLKVHSSKMAEAEGNATAVVANNAGDGVVDTTGNNDNAADGQVSSELYN